MSASDRELFALGHAGENPEDYLGAVIPPIFMNTLHVYDTIEEYMREAEEGEDKFYYNRSANPTARTLEKKVALLENGKDAVSFSGGMAAAAALLLTVCGNGSHIVCMKDVYQPVKRFINQFMKPRYDIEVTYIKGESILEYEKAITQNTKLIILESPSTFVLGVAPIKEIANLAKKYNIKTYLDNSAATPLNQKPLDLGIDYVMHSCSKYLGGHSDASGGIIVANDLDFINKLREESREWIGSVIGPMSAWLIIRGMRTLDIRLRQHEQTAQKVADFLENHPKVKNVYYTGLESNAQKDLIKAQQKGHGGLVSFELHTEPEKAFEMINHLEIFKIGCSWGGTTSLVIAPLYNSTQEELDFLNLSNGLVRLFCGLDDADSLIKDLTQALKKI